MNKEDLRIVFFGTPDFAVESLRRLVEGGYNIVGVVTMPDKIAGRGHRLIQSAVKQYAVEQGLNLMMLSFTSLLHSACSPRWCGPCLHWALSTCTRRYCPSIVVQRPSIGQ